MRPYFQMIAIMARFKRFGETLASTTPSKTLGFEELKAHRVNRITDLKKSEILTSRQA